MFFVFRNSVLCFCMNKQTFCVNSWQRVVSAATDIRALGSCGDHEAEAYSDPAEQDWSSQGEPGQGAVWADPGLCQRWAHPPLPAWNKLHQTEDTVQIFVRDECPSCSKVQRSWLVGDLSPVNHKRTHVHTHTPWHTHTYGYLRTVGLDGVGWGEWIQAWTGNFDDNTEQGRYKQFASSGITVS